MRSVDLAEIARVTGGSVAGPSRLAIRSVGTDTRDLAKKELFVALKGKRHDAHAFLEDVARSGVKAAMVARENPLLAEFRDRQPEFPLVMVKDTLAAMGDLAAHVRRGLEVRSVGITGTTGKTCTKDYLVSILSTAVSVIGSRGSFNNEVGLPMTIFSANGKDRVLVVEMGARRPGDISRLAEIAAPEYGVITNIGPGHLELFKTEDAVANTKAELARALPEGGVLVLNADDRWSRWTARQTAASPVRFGSGRGADYRSTRVSLDQMGRPEFELHGPGFSELVRLPGVGRHQVPNAVAAAACAHVMGVSAEGIAQGLEGASLSPWRMEVRESADGHTVINDCYNANPVSMNAALKTLRDIAGSRRTIAVLGGMAELGKGSRMYHEEVGRLLVALDLDVLVTVGRKARIYASSAVAHGMPGGSVFRCPDVPEAELLLTEIVEPGDVMLVKASRVMGLEALVRTVNAPGFSSGKTPYV